MLKKSTKIFKKLGGAVVNTLAPIQYNCVELVADIDKCGQIRYVTMMPLQLESISLAPTSPYGWDFERRLEILEDHGEVDSANRPGDIIPVLRFIRGHAVATSAVWLADQPFKLLERESRPNRCLVPVRAASLTGNASGRSFGPVAMLGALARQINTTEIAGVTILSEMLDGDETASFVIPRPFWMKWLEPSSDVRDFIPRRRRIFPIANWSSAGSLSGAPV